MLLGPSAQDLKNSPPSWLRDDPTHWVGIKLIFFVLVVFMAGGLAATQELFFQVENVITPIKGSTDRQATTLGFAKSGEIYRVTQRNPGWVEIRYDIDSKGWVSEINGSFTQKNSGKTSSLPFVLGGLLGLTLGGLLALTLLRWRQNRTNRHVIEGVLASDRSRRGKRILAIVKEWPEVAQTLDSDSRPMASLLREWGYNVATAEAVEGLLTRVRSVQPNIIMARSNDAAELELILAQDATLANTPVIYLGEKPPRLSEGHSIRLHWALGGNDKTLSETLAVALRRSPKTIRHAVRTEGISGELDGVGLWEVLHFLAALRKSGTLKVDTAKLTAEIRLAYGEILFARMAELTDTEAVDGMLNLESGHFAFFESQTPAQGKGLNTERLLLNWAKNRDETHDGTGN